MRDETVDEEQCRTFRSRGQFLARQDRWGDLLQEIEAADISRSTTPEGMPIADLLAFGARSDVINAVDHAMNASGDPADRALIDGIMALEAARMEFRENIYMAVIVALAHIDIGWSWRTPQGRQCAPKAHQTRSTAHFGRAASILADFKGTATNSPLRSATECALFSGQDADPMVVADAYGALIDQDPQNHRHMRALGNILLPRWRGTYDALDLEARRTAARTADYWGAGGYTWVYFDAIIQDEGACEHVDLAFFEDGLHDILQARGDQSMANLLAAYCGISLRRHAGRCPLADQIRRSLSAASDWIIRDHLTEVYPLIWAHASEGFDNNTRVTSPGRFAAKGRSDALNCLTELFRPELKNGQSITFTAGGLDLGQEAPAPDLRA